MLHFEKLITQILRVAFVALFSTVIITNSGKVLAQVKLPESSTNNVVSPTPSNQSQKTTLDKDITNFSQPIQSPPLQKNITRRQSRGKRPQDPYEKYYEGIRKFNDEVYGLKG